MVLLMVITANDFVTGNEVASERTRLLHNLRHYMLPSSTRKASPELRCLLYFNLRLCRKEVNIPYKSDFIQRMKERILVTNPIKEKLKESQKDYKLKIVPQNTQADAELKIFKIPIPFRSSLLNSLLIFDDIGSNADIQRFSSGLARTITHLVSDSRHSKNTVFFVAQRPSYLFKTARILSHVIKDIVPDQATPASDAIPLVDSGTGVAGTSNEYSGGDHKHPLQVSDVLPSKDTSVGTVGQASSYARSDHQHPIQTVDTIPVSDSADGSYGIVESYARNDHSHPINVQTNTSIIPIVDGVGNSGTSAYYSRHDHVHPQQLTYDGNVTATKFIKAGGTSNDILLADGSTRQSSLAALNTSTDNSIKFEVNTRTGFGQLQFNQHCAFQGNITDILTTDSQDSLPEDYSVIQQLFPNQYNTVMTINPVINGTFNEGIRISRNPTNLWSNIQFGSDPNSDVGYIDNQWLIGSTGNNTVIYKINPTSSAYDDGLRIGRPTGDGLSSVYLGCSSSSVGAISGQWSICSPNSGFQQNPLGLTIQRCADVSTPNGGLQISADGNTLTFNGSVL
ncbi:MAG: hypothetical protein EZS28_017402 [Streblomastix strix]|uniref:Uncharacterized protein n=1 Tax=Streblomastix strix TaxID=222440 RepID=A0A5J4VXB0_9EUKA|nr:MAG: hypothetical protein EZS28_017402 [Streblomastix strix]